MIGYSAVALKASTEAASGWRKGALRSAVSASGLPEEAYTSEFVPVETETTTEDEMREFAQQRIARHKVPRYIRFVDTFPMNAAGKVLKYKMRQDAARELGFNVEEADRLGS